MATTKSKKEIVDYLWERADKSGEWAKRLTNLAIQKESSFSESELTDIYALYFTEFTADNKESLPKISRPVIDLTPSDIILESLSEIKDVNRLAEDQSPFFR